MDAMDVAAPGEGQRPAPVIQPNPALDVELYGIEAMDTGDHRVDDSGADQRNAIDFPDGGSAPFVRLYNSDILPQPSRNKAFRANFFYSY